MVSTVAAQPRRWAVRIMATVWQNRRTFRFRRDASSAYMYVQDWNVHRKLELIACRPRLALVSAR
jgi:hypothetical protein